MIQTRNIYKIIGKSKIISNISFKVINNQIIGLLGPNGSGKTTLLKLLVGYLYPNSGEILLLNKNIETIDNDIKLKISYLPENNPLYLNMYTYEFLEFIAKIYHVPKKQIKNKIDSVMHLCEIYEVRNKKIKLLSKGYKQRVGIAKCLINNPKVIFLDEPLSGLDPISIRSISSIIKKMSENRTIFLSSHLLNQVEKLCDRILIINKGELILDTNNAVNTKSNKLEYRNIFLELKENIDTTIFSKLIHQKHIEKKGSLYKFRVDKQKTDFREKLFLFIKNQNLTLLTLKEENESLEDLFNEVVS